MHMHKYLRKLTAIATTVSQLIGAVSNWTSNWRQAPTMAGRPKCVNTRMMMAAIIRLARDAGRVAVGGGLAAAAARAAAAVVNSIWLYAKLATIFCK